MFMVEWRETGKDRAVGCGEEVPAIPSSDNVASRVCNPDVYPESNFEVRMSILASLDFAALHATAVASLSSG